MLNRAGTLVHYRCILIWSNPIMRIYENLEDIKSYRKIFNVNWVHLISNVHNKRYHLRLICKKFHSILQHFIDNWIDEIDQISQNTPSCFIHFWDWDSLVSQALCQWLGCDTLSDSAWPDHISPGNNVTRCHTLCHEAPTTRLHLITIWNRAVLLNWVLCLIKYTTSEKNNYEMCTLILKVYTGEYCGNVVD